jgi:beta-lactamase class A
MDRLVQFLVLLVAFLTTVTPVSAIDAQKLVDRTAAEVLAEFPNLKSNQLAVSLVVLPKEGLSLQGSYRGKEPIYPASVVKLFYLVAAHRWMEDARIADTPELRRAMRAMIVDSSNDATHYVVDMLTATTGGPELPESEMKEWSNKRNAVNRYFRSLGYENINVNQKPWCEGPYGRERIWVGASYTNRNALTTEATARLLTEIVAGLAVSAPRSAQMMELLKRERNKESKDAEDQATGFTGLGLPKGAQLWSKAGWTSTARHDAAYVELPGGEKFILVTFTTGHSNNRDIISSVTRRIVAGLGSQ